MVVRSTALCCCLLLGLSCLAVPTPAPSEKDLEAGEMSLRADIRFGSLPSAASALDLIPVTADAEGHVHVTLP